MSAPLDAGELPRVLSLDAVERLAELGVPTDLLLALAASNEALWSLEDDARGPDATIAIKRAIDRENARRHEHIDRVGVACAVPPTAPEGERRTYSETPGELCDRLIIIALKLRHAMRSQSDVGLAPEARRLCATKSIGLRQWQGHLQRELASVLNDLKAGRAILPPRTEFKMYNDAELNPVLRDAMSPARRSASEAPAVRVSRRDPSIQRVLGIACTGHGVSLAYLGPEGARASVLDRKSRSKYTLMFAADEARDILGRASPIDAAIYDSLTYTYGRFPDYRVFEDELGDWLAWLTRDLDVSPQAIDLVVTSDSHFATCDARLGRHLGRWLPRARTVGSIEHHQIHQAQAFWASGMPDAVVLTLDTCGESLFRLADRKIAGTIAHMDRNGEHRTISEFLFPECSAGILYAIVNHHVGFREGEEGKTMGLAPYGEPDLYDRMRPMLRLVEDGAFEFLEPREFYRLLGLYTPARQRGQPLTDRLRNVAYAGQRLLEDIVSNAMRASVRHGGERLAYAGGVALNSVANDIARRAVSVADLYVPPNPGDPGHALGCALIGAYELAGWPAPDHALTDYLGPHYRDDEIEAAARASKTLVTRVVQPERLLARCIAAGHVVARFEGGAEFGPRALGNRSLLCDPRRPEMRDYLNLEVKRREAFRPFAPSVLLEHVAEWFELSEPSPFMLRVVPVRRERAAQVPAIVHVDGTARVQTVAREDHPTYWALIDEFARQTGVPMVLNTSFNLDGQPIVESPADAVACYEDSRIDVLAMGSWILSKRPLDELTRSG